LDKGILRTFIEASYPLSESRQAYARAEEGKIRGKVVVQLS
jgi:NADPH:quinone reductase-like Zn-dependent oxidoreductase